MPRDKSYYALSKNDRVLTVCGVPQSHLKKMVSPQQLGFETITLTNTVPAKTITPSDQYDVFQYFLSNLDCMGQPSIYGIGSYPTDQSAYQMAVILTKAYNEYCIDNNRFPLIKWIDMGRPDWSFLKTDEDIDLLFIHNITANSEPKRFEATRDFLLRANKAMCFVVALYPNVFDLFNRLGMAPDGIFQLAKIVHRVHT